MLPDTGTGFTSVGIRANVTRAEAPAVPAAEYPEATMLAVVQLIVLVLTVDESTRLTLAAHKVYPALGAAEIVLDHPDGAVKEPLLHVYVDVPDMLGIVIAHWYTVGLAF